MEPPDLQVRGLSHLAYNLNPRITHGAGLAAVVVIFTNRALTGANVMIVVA